MLSKYTILWVGFSASSSAILAIFMEIAIYAILALFIFGRLYSSFGRGGASSISGKIINLSGSIDKQNNKSQLDDQFLYLQAENYSELLSQAKKIKKFEQGFSTDKFMIGAESAFEIVISAFAKCELKTLQKLVDDKLLQTLISKIEKRKLANHKLENTLIAVTSKKIVGLDLSDGVVFAKVKFASEQVSITKDDKENIISGAKKSSIIVKDMWTFKRALNSSSPNWFVTEMK